MFGIIVLGFAMKTLIERFTRAPPQSADTRIALAKAAINMANDGPIGVGLNNFGLKVNPPYPYADHIDRTKRFYKEGIVETIYLLIAAETGWFNLFIFLWWIWGFYGRNLLNIIRYRGKQIQYVPIALVGALTGVYLESTLEWVLKQTSNFYQLMILFGMISAMMLKWRNEQRIEKKRKLEEQENIPEETNTVEATA